MTETDFERFYREKFGTVYRYALSLTRDAAAAEELTQDCFFKALESLEQFRGESSLKTWLCAIVKNAFLSSKRRAAAEPLDGLPEPCDPNAGPEELALRRDEVLQLHRALHALPEPYREVFTLRVFGQLHFREIAELFGKTENWACVVYHRARQKLKEEENK